ncbi:hypothetical protein AFCA_007663 [Aspergillus flavus]|nr:hypothetical protein AFCA_007663 [Aspergillus flavus]
MFCLRSWLPLLFIPTNASPLFIVSFVTLTYILHRPYRCFFDLRGDWFAPRYSSDPSASSVAPNETVAGFILETVNTTTKNLAGVVVDEAQRRLALNGSSAAAGLGGLVQEEWTGVGLEWLRSLLGRREWTIPCVDVKVRL